MGQSQYNVLFALGGCVISKFIARFFHPGLSGGESRDEFRTAGRLQVIENAKPNDEKKWLEPRYKVRFIEEDVARLVFDVKEIQ